MGLSQAELDRLIFENYPPAGAPDMSGAFGRRASEIVAATLASDSFLIKDIERIEFEGEIAMVEPASGQSLIGTVAINDLILDHHFQIRQNGTDEGTVYRYGIAYRNQDNKIPPVQAARLDDALYLYDGWHRIEALVKLGQERVSVVVRPVENEAQIKWLAAQANLSNGLPLKRKDLREVFRAFISAKQHHKKRRGTEVVYKSYREIAAELQVVSYSTVLNWMRKDYPKTAARMGGADPIETTGGHRGKAYRIVDAIRGDLCSARNTFRRLSCEGERGLIIQETERILSEMKAGAAWVFPVSDEHDDF